MAKIFGQLEKAQLENTTSDTASLPKGTVTYRTDLNQAKVSNGTVMKPLAELDVTNALELQEIATPATPSSGTGKIYFKSDGKLYQLNDDGTETEVGSGSGGGGINYIGNPDAESNTTGWATYADAAGTRPVDGTGGSPTVTWTRSTSSPLRGTANFLFTKDAANRQGEGVSYDLTIDSADQAKVLQISFDYQIASGTYSGGTSSTDSDLIAYIYRTTATGRLIEPSVIKLDGGVVGVNYSYRGEFQADSDATGYRLILHVATTSASAYTVKVDNIVVGPSKNVTGSVITDWEPYTVLITAVSSNPTKGTTTLDQGWYRRVGSAYEFRYDYIQTVAGTAGTGTYLFSLPSGVSFDTTKMSVGTTISQYVIGVAGGVDGSSAGKVGTVVAYDSTHFALTLGDDTNPQTFVSSTFMGLNSAIKRYSASFSAPISGATATATLGQDADTRTCTAAYATSVSQSLANNTDTIIDFATLDYDDQGSVTTGAAWKFTAKTSGRFIIRARLALTADNGWAVAERLALEVRRNGNTSFPDRKLLGVFTGVTGTAITAKTGGSASFNLNAGDYLQVYANQNSGGAITLNGSSIENHVEIERVSGPSQIAASEIISLKYTNVAGTSITGASVDVPFATLVSATHPGAFNGTTFTAPIAGRYRFVCNLYTDPVNQTVSQGLQIQPRVTSTPEGISSSTRIKQIAWGAGVSRAATITWSETYNMIAGNTVTINAASDVTVGLSTGLGRNFLCIDKVG